MKICYLDAFSGISGDMTVGALIDAGADSGAVVLALEGLGTGAQFKIEKTKRCGITASKFRVIGGHATGHRHLKDILGLIDASALPGSVKQAATAVFQRLGEAEAKVHDISIDKVHFHEVGAVDSICDIVGACAAFDLLDVDEIHSSPVNVGSGTVKTEHGVLPVPAPATAELLTGKPVYARGPSVELTTPTGAALAATLAIEFGPLPPMQITATGYGAGDKDFQEHANVLRVLIGETTGAGEATTVAVLESPKIARRWRKWCSPKHPRWACGFIPLSGALRRGTPWKLRLRTERSGSRSPRTDRSRRNTRTAASWRARPEFR
jgi:uncharacterized protein (TIGR00299 family) protein